MKKLVILLAVIISLSSRGQKYTSDSTTVCPIVPGIDCQKYANETKLTFSPSTSPTQLEVYFPRTRTTAIIILHGDPKTKVINDSTNMVFYAGEDSQEAGYMLTVGIKIVKRDIIGISVQDEDELVIFSIKKDEPDNTRTK